VNQVGVGALPDRGLHDARIVIGGASAERLRPVTGLLDELGYHNLALAANLAEVPQLCAETPPDLILLELGDEASFAALEMLAPWVRREQLTVPLVAIFDGPAGAAKERAVSLGARDLLSQPLDRLDLELCLRRGLQARATELALRDSSRRVECAEAEALERLTIAAEFGDDDPREHMLRVGRTSELIARALGLGEPTVELIRRAAPLHDLGKLAISDSLLLKPGRLTPAEFELMKAHVSLGSEILAGTTMPVLQICEQIVRTHHERWDGTGYVSGLRGEEIPASGRIAAVADVFDALTHRRPYKEPWPVEDAVHEIHRTSGSQFDPRVVEAFGTLDHAELLTPVRERRS